MTHSHLKFWVCIENAKMKKWKTSSPGEITSAGEHVFQNDKMFIFFSAQTFKISKHFSSKNSKCAKIWLVLIIKLAILISMSSDWW